MPGPKVFVSYSHRDEKALEQLQRFLHPLEREGLITAWADTRIEGGHDWRKEIETALADATVAVLLISQDFLSSRFITEEEMPRILAREAAGKMTILPVFLSPSLVDEIDYPDPCSGGRVLLTKFQGYGTPDKPLSEYEWSQRDRYYKDLAGRLKSLAGTAPAEAPLKTASFTAGPARAYELTVQIEQRGIALLITYHLPGLEPLGVVEVPLAEVMQQIKPIHEVLDTSLNSVVLGKLKASQDGWGEALFHLLFPKPDLHEKIFRTVFGKLDGQRPNPVFGPVRLRVHAEDARLSNLPWRITSWKGQPLVDSGWTFTTTHTVDPDEDHLTTAPSNVLILAPQTAGNSGVPHDPAHAQAVRDVLRKAWPTGRDPGYVQVVTTRAQLEDALSGLRPHILYVYGPGTITGGTGGRPSLLLEGAKGEDPLPLAELRRLFQITGQPPAVLYLNVEGLTDSVGVAPDQILGGLPLLLWSRRPEWSSDSTTLALLWLHRWLGQGEDPVAAFHKVQADLFPPSCEAHTLGIHSNYRTWRTSTYQAAAQQPKPSLRLDRYHQKSLVHKHLEELVRSGTRRVMALAPYAAPGSSISRLWDQLRHDLELSLSHLVEINWIHLQFPEGRSNFRHDLEEELKLQLGAQPHEPVPYLLRRHAPKVVGPGKKPVLWLDWGTFGTASGLPPKLEDEHLEAWLRFSSEYLGTHCPDDLRIVSYIAQEIPAAALEEHGRTLQEQRRQPWCRTPAFRLSELPPLGQVGESDLLDFLEDPNNSSCDPGIQTEIAERIIAKTGGTFEATVALLQEAESGSWYDLLAQLRREQGGGPTVP